MKYQVIAGLYPGPKKNYPKGAILTEDLIDDAARRVKDGWLKIVEDTEVASVTPVSEVVAEKATEVTQPEVEKPVESKKFKGGRI